MAQAQIHSDYIVFSSEKCSKTVLKLQFIVSI